jgi:hypothetical protein
LTALTQKRDWKPQFLAAFEELGLVTEAARRVGISRQAAYLQRHSDPDFAEAWDEIEHNLTERLEREAYRRATEGTERHFYDARGNLLRTEQTYSDTLAIFLLKARKPEMYRETTRTEITGVSGGPIELVVPDQQERRAEVAEILAASRAIEA